MIDTALDPADTTAVTELAQRVDIDLEGDPDSLKICGRTSVTERIRDEDITEMSSIVSTIRACDARWCRVNASWANAARS